MPGSGKRNTAHRSEPGGIGAGTRPPGPRGVRLGTSYRFLQDWSPLHSKCPPLKSFTGAKENARKTFIKMQMCSLGRKTLKSLSAINTLVRISFRFMSPLLKGQLRKQARQARVVSAPRQRTWRQTKPSARPWLPILLFASGLGWTQLSHKIKRSGASLDKTRARSLSWGHLP